MTRLDGNNTSDRHQPLSNSCPSPDNNPPNPSPNPDPNPDPIQFRIVPIFFENDYLRARDRGDLSKFTAAYNPSSSKKPAAPFPLQFPLPDIGRITMADRFPDIGDVDLGKIRSIGQACDSDLLCRRRAYSRPSRTR
jgi:hypothetical protein